MALDFNNPAVIAAVVAGIAGVVLKLVDKWLNRSQSRTTEAQTIRDELRKDIADYKERNAALTAERDAIEKEADEWKIKYFEQVNQINELKQKILELLAELQGRGAVDAKVSQETVEVPLDEKPSN